MRIVIILPWLFLAAGFRCAAAWGKEKVKLTDIGTLTLYHGKMTAGRRSSPVPQLHCVGGTAGCAAFVPQVVQCYNRGTDGYDVQWECKTDMDNAFRFGRVEVLCEGYDNPDDPYVLKGSCGLEYTLDLTMEGMKKQQGHNYYGGGGQSYHTDYNKPVKSTRMSDIILLVIVLLLIYGLYKTCIRRSQYSPTDDDSSGSDSGFRSSGFGYGAPPPPGFRTDYTSGYDAGCSGARPHGYGSSSGAGNFWTGAATGGLLGYMFGSRNSGSNQGYRSSPTSGDSWGGTSSFTSSPESTGTRTASGFGGTRRR